MFDRDNWQEIWSTISKNKLRTTLTALGVAWGIFMLVVMLGCGNGLQHGVLSDFNGTATNSFFVWTQRTSKPYKGMKPGRGFNFTNEDVAALRKQIPELDVIAPQNQLGDYGGANNVMRGIKTGAFSVMADYPAISKIQAIRIKKGRFLNDNDLRESRKVAVIGKRPEEVLFGKSENILGEYIQINGVYFQVIGITEPTGAGDQSREQSEAIYVPFTTFQHTFNYGDKVGWFAITSKNNVSASLAEEKALALLKERHNVAPDDLIAIGHWNMEKQFKKLSGLFDGISMLVWFVGIGTLLAGVIGVSNIMLIVVRERTKEIGIKRAIGATPYAIVLQLMLESIFLTSFAGYFGLVAGIGTLEGVSSLMGAGTGMFRNPSVDLSVALKALTVLIFSGALAGLIPASRAISISPVDALRSE
jgi:putative ABC transport system permease protein